MTWVKSGFSVTYHTLGILLLLLVALTLLSGSNPVDLYVRHDLLSDGSKLIFVFGFLLAYLIALICCNSFPNLPGSDFLSRVFSVHFFVYATFGLILSVARLPLISRTVILSEFLLSIFLLTLFFFVYNRVFPKRIGLLPGLNLSRLPDHPSFTWISLKDSTEAIPTIDAAVVNLSGLENTITSGLLARLAQKKIPVYDVRAFFESQSGRVILEGLTNAELEQFVPPDLYSKIKRAADVLLVISIMPITLPLCILIGLLVKCDTPGPVIFTQERIGYQKKKFLILKFRSMHAERRPKESRFSTANDSRITRVGSFLRRYRLDELPQLWNVLTGDMSLIGPRPEQSYTAY